MSGHTKHHADTPIDGVSSDSPVEDSSSGAYSEADDIAQHREDIERMLSMFSVAGCSATSLGCILDVGGGGGMHSALLGDRAERVICMDFIDQNARYGGQFIKLLREKMERNGCRIAVDRFEFHAGDAQNLMYRDNLFDTIVSFNALEHIPDPGRALKEMVRVLRPGGLLFVTFDPIWTCDSGSHFYSRVPVPWQHLVSEDDDFAAQIVSAGGTQDEVNEYRSAMNRRRLAEYRDAFAGMAEAVEVLAENEWSGTSNTANIGHENYALCLNHGFSPEELLLRGMAKVLRKRALVQPPVINKT